MPEGWKWLTAAVLTALLLVPAASVPAAERVALVVGNADYNETAARLRSPVNDATAIAAALRRLGFRVIEGKNLDDDGFYNKIGAFEDAMGSAKVALFFYAGHGLQVEGRNYLAPVDLKLERKQDLRHHAIDLDSVLEVMRSETKLVILDACRNNPLAGGLASSLGRSRETLESRGLAWVNSTSDMLIAYAAAPGKTAVDVEEDHSPYTAALLEHLETPGLSVIELFAHVSASVIKRTGERQRPWRNHSLSTIIGLASESSPEPTAAAPAHVAVGEPAAQRLAAERLATERLFWESVKDSTNSTDLRAYLERFPGGTYEVLARNRLQALQLAEAPTIAPERDAASLEAELELSRPERRLIQLGLLAAGFDLGKADGFIGDRSRAALRQWQASRNEENTGYLDLKAAELLMAAGEKEAARQAAAEVERLKREQETRDQMRREAEERARREAEAERRRRQIEAREKARQEAEIRRLAEDRHRRQEWEKLGLVMVRVDGGSFTMGCRNGRDDACDSTELPAHRVQVTNFEIGKYEVTQALWKKVMGGSPSRFGDCPMCPVEQASWDDVQQFLLRLNARTGGRYRLPTEAEWEYAARGGRQSRSYRYAGGNDPGSVGWHGNNSGGRTYPVGRRSGNELGLHDMTGNVLEWTQDCWNDSYLGAPDDGRAWEQGNCSRRVARGGSWAFKTGFLRTALRYWFPAQKRFDDVGLRLARTLGP